MSLNVKHYSVSISFYPNRHMHVTSGQRLSSSSPFWDNCGKYVKKTGIRIVTADITVVQESNTVIHILLHYSFLST
jgi:hypothetical protein